MANQLATVKVSLAYTGPSGQQEAPPTQQVVAPYQAQNVGAIDVPDSTASSTTYSIPFGSIGTAASLVVLQNNTGQELAIKINGAAAASHHMAQGGMLVIAENSAPGSTPVLSVSVTTTAMQAGAGSVGYYVFGDPV